MKKFDYIIGNPAYQDESVGNQKTFQPPIYHRFIDAVYEIGNTVELIHPARFLFNAGATPKEWNEKMLRDPHLKVLEHFQDSKSIFPGTDIKGGIVVTYRNVAVIGDPIGIYTPYPELRSVLSKVQSTDEFVAFSNIVSNRGLYRFSQEAYKEFPIETSKITDSRIGASAFERLSTLFSEEQTAANNQFTKFLGLLHGKRVYRWLRNDLYVPVASLNTYRVLLPGVNGSGVLGEPLSHPIVGIPGLAHTETFLTIGSFDTIGEADACLKYVKTKFCRSMLGILKITQHNSADKWACVPL